MRKRKVASKQAGMKDDSLGQDSSRHGQLDEADYELLERAGIGLRKGHSSHMDCFSFRDSRIVCQLGLIEAHLPNIWPVSWASSSMIVPRNGNANQALNSSTRLACTSA